MDWRNENSRGSNLTSRDDTQATGSVVSHRSSDMDRSPFIDITDMVNIDSTILRCQSSSNPHMSCVTQMNSQQSNNPISFERGE